MYGIIRWLHNVLGTYKNIFILVNYLPIDRCVGNIENNNHNTI